MAVCYLFKSRLLNYNRNKNKNLAHTGKFKPLPMTDNFISITGGKIDNKSVHLKTY